MAPIDQDDDEHGVLDGPSNPIIAAPQPPAVFDSRTKARRRISEQAPGVISSLNRHRTPVGGRKADEKASSKKKLKQTKLPVNFGGSASVSYGQRRTSAGGARRSSFSRTTSSERLIEDTANRSAPTIRLADQQMQRMKEMLAADSMARPRDPALQKSSTGLADRHRPQPGPSKPNRRTPGAISTAEDGPEEESGGLPASDFPRTLLFQKKRALTTNLSTHRAQQPTTMDPPCHRSSANRRVVEPEGVEPELRTRRDKPEHPTRPGSVISPRSSPRRPLNSHATPVRPVQEMVYPLGIDIETQCSPLTYQLAHPPEKIRQLNRSHGGWLERKGDASQSIGRREADENGFQTGARNAPVMNADMNINSVGRYKQDIFNRENTPDPVGFRKDDSQRHLSPLASHKSIPDTDLRSPQKNGGQRSDGRLSGLVEKSTGAKSVGYHHPRTDARILSPAKSIISTVGELSDTEYESDVQPAPPGGMLCPNSSSLLANGHDQVPVQPDCFDLGEESVLPETQKRYSVPRLMFVEDLLEEGADGVDLGVVEESMLPQTQKPGKVCRLLFDDERIDPDQSSMVDAGEENYGEGVGRADQVHDGFGELGVDGSNEHADVTLQAETGGQQPALTSTPTRSRVLVEETQASDFSSPSKSTKILVEESQELSWRHGPGRSLAPPTPVPVRVKALEKFQSGSGRRSSPMRSAPSSNKPISFSSPPPSQPPVREELSPSLGSVGGNVVPRKRPTSSMTTRIKNAWTTAPESRIPTAPTLKQVGILRFCVSGGVSSSATAAGRAAEEERRQEREARARALAVAAEECLGRMTSGRGAAAEVRDDAAESEEDDIVDQEPEGEETIPGSDEMDGRLGSEELVSALEEQATRKRARLTLAAQLERCPLTTQDEYIEAEGRCTSELRAGGQTDVTACRTVNHADGTDRQARWSSSLTMGGGDEEEEDVEDDDEDVDVSTQHLIEISEALLNQQRQ